MQKFPKVLRFYRKNDKEYYTFGGQKFTGSPLLPQQLLGNLTEEQQFMANKMRENDN